MSTVSRKKTGSQGCPGVTSHRCSAQGDRGPSACRSARACGVPAVCRGDSAENKSSAPHPGPRQGQFFQKTGLRHPGAQCALQGQGRPGAGASLMRTFHPFDLQAPHPPGTCVAGSQCPRTPLPLHTACVSCPAPPSASSPPSGHSLPLNTQPPSPWWPLPPVPKAKQSMPSRFLRKTGPRTCWAGTQTETGSVLRNHYGTLSNFMF